MCDQQQNNGDQHKSSFTHSYLTKKKAHVYPRGQFGGKTIHVLRACGRFVTRKRCIYILYSHCSASEQKGLFQNEQGLTKASTTGIQLIDPQPSLPLSWLSKSCKALSFFELDIFLSYGRLTPVSGYHLNSYHKPKYTDHPEQPDECTLHKIT